MPTLGYTVDSVLRCAPVASFAPAHVALRAAFCRLPSQPPLACVRSRLISLRFTLRAARGSLSLYGRLCRPTGCLRQAVLVRIPPGMSHPSGCLYSLPRNRPACDLRCATVASIAPAHLALRAAFGRLPSQRPLACVPVSGFRSQVSGFRSQVSALPLP